MCYLIINNYWALKPYMGTGQWQPAGEVNYMAMLYILLHTHSPAKAAPHNTKYDGN